MSFYDKNDIVEMAVRMEQNGYAFYDKALQRSDLDNETRSILTALRDDEKEHEKTFQALETRWIIMRLDKIPTGMRLNSI